MKTPQQLVILRGEKGVADGGSVGRVCSRAILLSRGPTGYSPPLQAAKSLQTAKSGRSIAPPWSKPRSLPLRADKVSKVRWQAESKLTFGRLVLPVAMGMKPAATSSSSCRGEPAKQSLAAFAAPDRGDHHHRALMARGD